MSIARQASTNSGELGSPHLAALVRLRAEVTAVEKVEYVCPSPKRNGAGTFCSQRAATMSVYKKTERRHRNGGKTPDTLPLYHLYVRPSLSGPLGSDMSLQICSISGSVENEVPHAGTAVLLTSSC